VDRVPYKGREIQVTVISTSDDGLYVVERIGVWHRRGHAMGYLRLSPPSDCFPSRQLAEQSGLAFAQHWIDRYIPS
jgi:hypothetical protein